MASPSVVADECALEHDRDARAEIVVALRREDRVLKVVVALVDHRDDVAREERHRMPHLLWIVAQMRATRCGTEGKPEHDATRRPAAR